MSSICNHPVCDDRPAYLAYLYTWNHFIRHASGLLPDIIWIVLQYTCPLTTLTIADRLEYFYIFETGEMIRMVLDYPRGHHLIDSSVRIHILSIWRTTPPIDRNHPMLSIIKWLGQDKGTETEMEYMDYSNESPITPARRDSMRQHYHDSVRRFAIQWAFYSNLPAHLAQDHTSAQYWQFHCRTPTPWHAMGPQVVCGRDLVLLASHGSFDPRRLF